MKYRFVTSLAVFVTGISSVAISQEHERPMDNSVMHPQAQLKTPMADALVKKIDKGSGTVTLSHGSLPSGMPAMTMAYRVQDATWLGHMKEGEKIRFSAEEVNGAMTIVRFKPIE